MSAPRPSRTQLGISFAAHKAPMSLETLRRSYHLLLRTMTELGVPPTELAAVAPGIGKNFGDFKRKRRRFEAATSGVVHVGLRHLRPERDARKYGFFDWTAYGGSGLEDGLHPEFQLMMTTMTVFHEDAGLAESVAMEHVLRLARETVVTYGYITLFTRKDSLFPHMGGPDGRGMWLDCYFPDHVHRSILRDVYPYNFLSRSYLDIPMEDTTLEGWIRRSDDRGRLEPFNQHVMLWQPPAGQIPRIRETLYRAGHLLYYYFFDPSSRHYRDWSRPFVPSEPIPDTFRAETYAGTDPRVMT